MRKKEVFEYDVDWDKISTDKTGNFIIPLHSSELFLDLPLYNSRLDEEKILNIILNTIKIREYSMQVVLCLSDKKDRDSNIATLNLFDKYLNTEPFDIF